MMHKLRSIRWARVVHAALYALLTAGFFGSVLRVTSERGCHALLARERVECDAAGAVAVANRIYGKRSAQLKKERKAAKLAEQ